MYYRIDGIVVNPNTTKSQTNENYQITQENFTQSSNKWYHSPWIIIILGILLYIIIMIFFFIQNKNSLSL
jgi:uncharacterized integral membrane protein